MENHSRPAGYDSYRHHLRLIITVPTLLILFVLAYGLVSLLVFDHFWEDLERLGAWSIASQLLRTHLYAMLVLAVLALIMGIALTRSILRPVRAIVEASRLAAQGQFNRAAEIPASRELEDLSKSFNQMVGLLNRSVVERDRWLMQSVPFGMMMTDLEGRLTALSPKACELLGCQPRQVMGRALFEIHGEVNEEGRNLLNRIQKMVMRMMASPEDTRPPAEEKDAAWLLTAAFMRQAEGHPTGYVFSFSEAGPVKELNSHLDRTNQLAALGAFTLGLAHELRNPLATVKGVTQLLAMDPSTPETANSYLQRIVHEVDRVDVVIKQLLELAQSPAIVAQRVDLDSLIERACAANRELIGQSGQRGVRIETGGDPLPKVKVDGDRVAQALMHLINNALCHASDASAVRIVTRLDEQACETLATISILNAGEPLTPEVIERMYEPFYTTRDHATGLGLTIAHQIIEQNRGQLDIRNEADGVCCAVSFPVDEKHDSHRMAQVMELSDPGAAEPREGVAG